MRYFNAAGADPDCEIGENHAPEPHIIPRALMAAAGNLPHLEMFGTDCATHDGSCIRDYVHVTDLARVHVGALGHLLKTKQSGTFNIGTGNGYSVKEIVSMVEHVTGKKVPVRFGPRRPGDPERLIADSSLVEQALGIKLEYSDLKTIIETAWAWFTSEKNLHNFRCSD